MNIFRSSIKLFAANGFSAVVQFFGIVYFAREIGAAQMGVFFLFQTLLGLLGIAADFGLSGAIEKRISQGASQGASLSSVFLLKLISISVIVVGVLIAGSYVNRYVGTEVAFMLAIAVVIREIAKLSVSVLKGELRVGETAILKFAREGTWLVIGAILIELGLEGQALIYSLICGLVVVSVWGWLKVSIVPATPSMSHARSLFDYAKYNVVTSVGGYFYSWIDVAVIGLFLTQAHVGAYEIAWRVTMIPLLLSRAIATSIFPEISRLDAEDATSRIESVIRQTVTPSLLLAVPAFFGVIVFAREILEIGFGPEFTIASTVFIILASEKMLQAVHKILSRSLLGINHPEYAAKATIVSVVLNLVLNLILVYRFGIVGAAVATTSAFVVNTVLHGYYLSKYLSIRISYQEVTWCFVSAGMMSFCLYIIQLFINIDTPFRLVGVIFVGVVVYGLIVLQHKSIRHQIFNVLLR